METEVHFVARTVRQSRGRTRGPSEAGPSAEVNRTRSKSTFLQPCGSFAWREPEGQTERHRLSSVLFDGTHGISVNKRTRIRDQEPLLTSSVP